MTPKDLSYKLLAKTPCKYLEKEYVGLEIGFGYH